MDNGITGMFGEVNETYKASYAPAEFAAKFSQSVSGTISDGMTHGAAPSEENTNTFG